MFSFIWNIYEIFAVDGWGRSHLMHLYHIQYRGLLHIQYFQSLIGNSNFVNNVTQMMNKVSRWPLNIGMQKGHRSACIYVHPDVF